MRSKRVVRKTKSGARRVSRPVPKSFPKVSSAARRRELREIEIRVEAGKLLARGLGTPPKLPPEVMARMIDHLRQALMKALICAEDQALLDKIDGILKKGGLSPEDYKSLNDAGEALWESMVRMGC